jgi:hypothetical protein
MTRPLTMMGGGAMVLDGLVVELVVELELPVLSGGSVPVEPEPVVVPVPVLPEPLLCVKAGCNSENAIVARVIARTEIRGDIPPSCMGLIMAQKPLHPTQKLNAGTEAGQRRPPGV